MIIFFKTFLVYIFLLRSCQNFLLRRNRLPKALHPNYKPHTTKNLLLSHTSSVVSLDRIVIPQLKSSLFEKTGLLIILAFATFSATKFIITAFNFEFLSNIQIEKTWDKIRNVLHLKEVDSNPPLNAKDLSIWQACGLEQIRELGPLYELLTFKLNSRIQFDLDIGQEVREQFFTNN